MVLVRQNKWRTRFTIAIFADGIDEMADLLRRSRAQAGDCQAHHLTGDFRRKLVFRIAVTDQHHITQCSAQVKIPVELQIGHRGAAAVGGGELDQVAVDIPREINVHVAFLVASHVVGCDVIAQECRRGPNEVSVGHGAIGDCAGVFGRVQVSWETVIALREAICIENDVFRIESTTGGIHPVGHARQGRWEIVRRMQIVQPHAHLRVVPFGLRPI